jgi:hypothetical protein
VAVTPGVVVYANHPNSWGAVHATADAVVTSIVVD